MPWSGPIRTFTRWWRHSLWSRYRYCHRGHQAVRLTQMYVQHDAEENTRSYGPSGSFPASDCSCVTLSLCGSAAVLAKFSW